MPPRHLPSLRPGIGSAELTLDGIWQSDDGDSRYTAELCGNGSQLCAKLIWIRPGAISDNNKKYIGTDLVKEARLAGTKPFKWKGDIFVYGHTFNGSVTMVNPNRLEVRACAFVFFCEATGVNRMDAKQAKN